MATPSNNVFFGDLPTEFTQEDCERVFRGYGTLVQCKVMPPKAPFGKASALARFASVEEAQWVVESLNGNLAQGIDTPISIAFKREKAKGKGDGKGKNGFGKGKDSYGNGKNGYGKAATPAWSPAWSSSPYGNGKAGGKGGDSGAPAKPNTNVFISDLPAEVDDAKLAEVFGQYGTVTWSKVMASKGKPTNAAIVEFATVEEAQWVVESLNGNLAQGISTPINIAFKRERSKGKGDGKGKW